MAESQAKKFTSVNFAQVFFPTLCAGENSVFSMKMFAFDTFEIHILNLALDRFAKESLRAPDVLLA